MDVELYQMIFFASVFFFLAYFTLYQMIFFFCIYWDNFVVLIFLFITVVYHIGWFTYVELALWPWNESNLTVVYDPFKGLHKIRVEGRVLISCKNSKSTTCCWTTIDRRMLDPTIKGHPHIQGQRRSPRKMVGGEKLHLESNATPTRDA